MNIVNKTIENTAYNPWFALMSGLASMVSLLWLVYDKIMLGTAPTWILVIFILSITLFSVTLFYSVKIRVENIALRKLGETFHDINHLYRDELRKVFHEDCKIITNGEDLLMIERDVLRAVCQRIRNGFSELIGGRKTMVTIKLLVTTETGKKVARTYVRSMEKSKRDEEGDVDYEVETGKNTAFDDALRLLNHGPSHYFSPNLIKDAKEGKYSNQRTGYERHYRSTIVVPIRAKIKVKDSYTTDDIGFLTIDTKSINRLNGGYHVQIMAAFADQIYNFISLMRGKYLVLVDKKPGEK